MIIQLNFSQLRLSHIEPKQYIEQVADIEIAVRSGQLRVSLHGIEIYLVNLHNLHNENSKLFLVSQNSGKWGRLTSAYSKKIIRLLRLQNVWLSTTLTFIAILRRITYSL